MTSEPGETLAASVARIRLWLEMHPDSVNIASEIGINRAFVSDDWPYKFYAIDRRDLEAVLSAAGNHSITIRYNPDSEDARNYPSDFGMPEGKPVTFPGLTHDQCERLREMTEQDADICVYDDNDNDNDNDKES
jgi:hypothetical protein